MRWMSLMSSVVFSLVGAATSAAGCAVSAIVIPVRGDDYTSLAVNQMQAATFGGVPGAKQNHHRPPEDDCTSLKRSAPGSWRRFASWCPSNHPATTSRHSIHWLKS